MVTEVRARVRGYTFILPWSSRLYRTKVVVLFLPKRKDCQVCVQDLRSGKPGPTGVSVPSPRVFFVNDQVLLCYRTNRSTSSGLDKTRHHVNQGGVLFTFLLGYVNCYFKVCLTCLLFTSFLSYLSTVDFFRG